jgi:hypothetical protein
MHEVLDTTVRHTEALCADDSSMSGCRAPLSESTRQGWWSMGLTSYWRQALVPYPYVNSKTMNLNCPELTAVVKPTAAAAAAAAIEQQQHDKR